MVFGGTSGIGKAIVEIASCYNASAFALSTSNGCDITSFSSVSSALKKIYKQCKKIDFVVNCAGVLKLGTLQSRSIDDIKKEIDVNYIGSLHIIKASLPYLLKNPHSTSIALFSSSSYTRGRALYSIYSSTKAAIVNLGQALSEELKATNVKVNIINPARTHTPMRSANFGKEPEESLLSPNEVARATLCTLLSNLNGQIIDVRR
ncbi:SDR family oxidoreductase [Helicobacter sp.]|uniref:SDR family NAD(P)-dependent oxidoreductase n=1 Tax=Helicobacter sp. TaxID=218 RepID=UPI0025C0C8F9|nr:SDR family oxidoreductase [Helicobacter sp.]